MYNLKYSFNPDILTGDTKYMFNFISTAQDLADTYKIWTQMTVATMNSPNVLHIFANARAI